MSNERMRAAIYARVSSAGQRDRHTIASQLSTLPAYCERQGWEVVATHVDDGFSASAGKLEHRRGLARLLEDVAAGLVDVVVVVDMDRLTRSEDLAERGRILGAFQAAGVLIAESSGAVHDLREGHGDLMVSLRAILAAEENRKRRERTMRGRERAVAAGRLPSGPAPYGYRYDGGWQIHEPEAVVVRTVFAGVLAGRSCMELAHELNARKASLGRQRRNQAAEWSRAAVLRLVRHPVYRGEWVASKRARAVISVPPLVDAADWWRAQELVTSGKQRGLRRAKRVYLAEGLAVCELCGSRMRIKSGGKDGSARNRWSYYVCAGRLEIPPGQQRCRLPFIETDRTDTRIWAAVCDLLGPRWPDLAQRMRELHGASAPDAWARDLDAYRRRIDELTQAERRALGLARKGLLSEAALDQELAQLGRERVFLAQQIATCEQALARGRDTDPLSHLSAIRDKLPHAPPAVRRAIVATLVPGGQHRIVLGRETIEITVAIATGAPAGHVGGSGTKTSHEASITLRLVA